MVYIPWHQKGICRHWMLRQCRVGDACNYRHPAEGKEWHQAWNDAIEQQRIDEANGIKPPVKPTYKKAKHEKRAETRAQHEAREAELNERRDDEATECLDGAQDRAVNDAAHDAVSVKRPAGLPVGAWGADAASAQGAGRHLGVVATYRDAREDDPGIRVGHRVYGGGHWMRGGRGLPVLRADSKLCVKIRESHNPAEVLPRCNTTEDIETSRRELSFWEQGDAECGKKKVEINGHTMEHPASTPEQQLGKEMPMTGSEVSLKGNPKEVEVEVQQVGGARSLPTNALAAENLTPIPLWAAAKRDTTKLVPTVLTMGAVKRLSNGEIKHVGPSPSTMRVSAPYVSQAVLEKKLQPTAPHAQFDAQERSIAEAREDNIRLQGCRWLDDVRRALQLPIRTYTTACVYYHKFRLAHPGSLNGMEYGNAWADACAASLLTSCKVEDTLKKSRDILAAAYNAKVGPHDQLGVDDQLFEQSSRTVIGLERMVLEAGGFDFRSKYPHRLLVKLLKIMPEGVDDEREKVSKIAWTVLTDLHRTFAPLKQTSSTMALASIELATHMVAIGTSDDTSALRDAVVQFDAKAWSTTREEIMETILDALDLYTHHTQNTILGSKYTLDDFLRIRLVFNKECSENNIPRHTTSPPSDRPANGNTLRVQNGHPTPVSPPPQPGVQTQGQQSTTNGTTQPTSEGPGTLRFMLNPQLATDETAEIQKYFVEEWEEYEEEIEIIPPPRAKTPPRDRDRERDRERDRPSGPPPPPASRSERNDRPRDDREFRDRERDRERERPRDRERELERERPGPRGPPPPRFDDRRYDDRRYDERRDGRRFYEDRRRR